MAKAFVKLGRLKLRKLKPGQKVTEQGITFERLENGDGLYSVNIMVDGIRIHRVVGRESDGTWPRCRTCFQTRWNGSGCQPPSHAWRA